MTGIEQEKAAAWIPPARSHAHDAVPADSHSTASSSGASNSVSSNSVSSNSTALRSVGSNSTASSSVDSHSGAVFAVASSSVDLAAARAGTAAPVVAFARRPLAALLSASLISLLGTAMSQLAIPWMVLTTTGSAARTGTVAFAETAPYVALQALAGPLVDRLGARRACIAGNAAAAPVVCAIPALYAAGLLPLGALAALVGVAGAVRGLADCAANVLVPGAAKVGGVPLERAAGLSTGAGRAGLVLGAPLAGILITAAGVPVVVLADGITFAVAALLIAALLPTEIAAPATAPSDRGYLGQLGEGLRFIRTDRLLVGIIAMVAVANLLDQGLSAVLLPVWVRSHLHSPSSLGLIAGAMEIGALIGNIAGAWLGPRLPRRATYSVGWLLSGAPRFAVLVLAGTLSPILAVFAFVGLSGGAINPIIGALSYERVPPHLHARVLGTIKASAWIGIPFGSLIAGALTETVGLRATLIAAGATYFATTLAPFVSPTWHGMDHRPPPAPPGPV